MFSDFDAEMNLPRQVTVYQDDEPAAEICSRDPKKRNVSVDDVKAVRDAWCDLKKLAESETASEAELAEAFQREVPRLVDLLEKTLDVAEKSEALLANAYSAPDDERGICIQSEDAVKLQWALRAIGIGDDSGEPCFTV